MSKKIYIQLNLIALITFAITFQSCSSINKAEKGLTLGAAAGGAIGALVGKKAGNPAIGATIGAALGGTTGAFIGNKLARTSDNPDKIAKPLYVINGIPCKENEAESLLNHVKPEEIESIKVLPNNEAIAQYGNKGGNGAIVITFKNAKKS